MRYWIRPIALLLLLAAIVGGISALKFKAWRVAHPDAPAWVFWLSGR